MEVVTDVDAKFAAELDAALKGVEVSPSSVIGLNMKTQSRLEYLTEFALMNYKNSKEGGQTGHTLSILLTKYNPEAFFCFLYAICKEQYERMTELKGTVSKQEGIFFEPTDYVNLLRKANEQALDRKFELMAVLINGPWESATKKIAFIRSEIADNDLVIRNFTERSMALDHKEHILRTRQLCQSVSQTQRTGTRSEL